MTILFVHLLFLFYNDYNNKIDLILSYIAENIIESIKYKYLLTITYVIEINKEYYEIKKLKKLKRFTVTVNINEKQSKVEINHIVKINENDQNRNKR